MCLAIPMQIIEIDGFVACCEANGVQREVNLFMLQGEEIAVDDFVMVHVGYAIQKVAALDARSSWQMFDEMLKITDNEDA